MSRIRSKNTKPELLVRRFLHAQGYRYRLHRKGLPGTPDIVFGIRKKAVQVNGCFWHGHACKYGIRRPGTNADFWRQKISRNQQRDQENLHKLEALGWQVFTIWECELKHPEEALERLMNFLGPSGPQLRATQKD